jgi:hypothetical protein
VLTAPSSGTVLSEDGAISTETWGRKFILLHMCICWGVKDTTDEKMHGMENFKTVQHNLEHRFLVMYGMEH